MSIVDPIGKRAISSSKPTSQISTPAEAHLRGHENYDTPRSRDIFNVARRLEAGQSPVTPKKPSLAQRLLRTMGMGKATEELKHDGRVMTIDASQGRCLTREYQREHNPVHRQLPEEHLAAWMAEAVRKRQSAETASSSSQQRKFNGPVPRRPKLPETERLSHTLDTAFLSPLESEVYNIMCRVGRCATFTPFTSSRSEDRRQPIMLVHPSNVEPLQHIQSLATSLSTLEKHALLRSLQGLLRSHLLSTLKTVLLQPYVRITSSSQSGKGYSPEFEKALRKPKSWEFFSGKVSPSWERIDPVRKYVLYDQGNDQGQDYKRAPSIFKSFEQKEFIPDHHDPSDSESEEGLGLHLRGGGGGSSVGDGEDQRRPFPFERSVRAYVGHITRAGPLEALSDEKRVPRALFWLAGGRISSRKKAPTAGELRARRKAEMENYGHVGFVEAMFGIRRTSTREGRGGDTASTLTDVSDQHTEAAAAATEAASSAKDEGEEPEGPVVDPGHDDNSKDAPIVSSDTIQATAEEDDAARTEEVEADAKPNEAEAAAEPNEAEAAPEQPTEEVASGAEK